METMFWLCLPGYFLCWLFLPVPGNAKGPEMVVDLSVHADVSSPFKFIQS